MEEPTPECETCGTIEDLTFEPDPFNAEIYDDFTDVWMCGECRHIHAMDI